MRIKRVLRPEGLRRIPRQFSWIDQRLVSEHYLERCDATALALYLFLVTVADVRGLSYYGDAKLTKTFHRTGALVVFANARGEDLRENGYRLGTCLRNASRRGTLGLNPIGPIGTNSQNCGPQLAEDIQDPDASTV